jgi:hypothetical protein
VVRRGDASPGDIARGVRTGAPGVPMSELGTVVTPLSWWCRFVFFVVVPKGLQFFLDVEGAVSPRIVEWFWLVVWSSRPVASVVGSSR